MPKGCDVVAAKLRINAAYEVRVLAQEFKGKCYVHIREFALGQDNEYVPTPKGVSVPLENLEQVLDAVRDMREAGSKEGVVSAIPFGKGREIRFAITKWQGTTRADIRLYFRRGETSECVPTSKGLRVNLAMLNELERALEALDRALER